MKRAIFFACVLLLTLPQAFATNSDSWVELGELTASDGQAYDQFGTAVAMSGNTIVISAVPTANGHVGPGAVYVFVEPSAGNTQTAKLTASDGQPGDQFGLAVAISGDTIVVGASQPSVGQGAVYVFVKPKAGWQNMTETAKLTNSDGNFDDLFGGSVAVDGDTVVSGASNNKPPGYLNATGEVYVFTRPKGGWRSMTETEKFYPPHNEDRVYGLGQSVAIAGTTLAAGAPLLGSGYVVLFDTSSQTQIGGLFLGNAPDYILFGGQVVITPNADEVVVSAPFQTVAGVQDAGAIYVFEKPKGGWRNSDDYSAELTATDPSRPPDAAGLTAYAVSANGGEVVATGLNVNLQSPEYVFVRGSSGWQSMTQTYEIFESGGNFLESAGLSGNFICAGAGATIVNGNQNQGAAFVFELE